MNASILHFFFKTILYIIELLWLIVNILFQFCIFSSKSIIALNSIVFKIHFYRRVSQKNINFL